MTERLRPALHLIDYGSTLTAIAGLPRGLTLSFQHEPEKMAAVVRSTIKARAVQVAIASSHQIGIRTRNRRFRG